MSTSVPVAGNTLERILAQMAATLERIDNRLGLMEMQMMEENKQKVEHLAEDQKKLQRAFDQLQAVTEDRLRKLEARATRRSPRRRAGKRVA